MTGIDIVPVAAITVICYLASEVVKEFGIDKKWLPVVCGVSGCVLGVLGMYTMTDFPAHDWMTAASVGIISGLAATGAHQTYKQLKG